MQLVDKFYLKSFSKVYINSEYSHLIVVYGYKNLVIYSSLIPDTELYQEKDILPYTLSISQVIFDANMEFLILISYNF